MKESLYELSDQLNNVIWMMAQAQDNAENVMQEDVVMTEAMKQIEMDHASKVCDVGCAVKNIKAEANALGEEIKRLTERKKAKDNLVQRLKDYIMANTDTSKKYEDSRIRISFRESEKVIVADADMLHRAFQRITVQADKTAIKRAIKNGETVDGATIEASQSVILK